MSENHDEKERTLEFNLTKFDKNVIIQVYNNSLACSVVYNLLAFVFPMFVAFLLMVFTRPHVCSLKQNHPGLMDLQI